MSCRDVEKQISRLVDGDLPQSLAAQVKDHLSSCGACRAFHDQVVSLNDRLKACALGPVPSDLAARVRESITSQREGERRPFVIPAWCRVPLMAALVVVAVGIGGISGVSLGELVIQARPEVGMEDVIPSQTGSFAQVVFDLSTEENKK